MIPKLKEGKSHGIKALVHRREVNSISLKEFFPRHQLEGCGHCKIKSPEGKGPNGMGWGTGPESLPVASVAQSLNWFYQPWEVSASRSHAVVR